MTKTRWIPGPWFVDETGDTYYIEAEPGFNHAEALNREDAHLIAAAPDLYAALSEFFDEEGGYFTMMSHEGADKVRAALKKARGETND